MQIDVLTIPTGDRFGSGKQPARPGFLESPVSPCRLGLCVTSLRLSHGAPFTDGQIFILKILFSLSFPKGFALLWWGSLSAPSDCGLFVSVSHGQKETARPRAQCESCVWEGRFANSRI